MKAKRQIDLSNRPQTNENSFGMSGTKYQTFSHLFSLSDNSPQNYVTVTLKTLAQESFLLEDVLIDEGKERRPRPIVVIIIVGDQAVPSFALRYKHNSTQHRTAQLN